MIWAWVAGAFYVMGIVSAVHAIMATRTAQGAIAWSVSLIAIPFPAVPLYWVFGRNKFEGIVELRKAHEDEITHRIEKARTALERHRVTRAGHEGMRRALESLAGMGVLGGNEATLLVNGGPTFDSIEAGIRQAERYVLFQFYIIKDDGLGNRMADALIERAQAGIAVYVLYDEIGSLHLSRTFLDRLRQAGVRVVAFNTTQGRNNRFQLNFRNHRKIVVVDGHVAWIGGHNVGDEYVGLDPETAPWRDTHVRVAGPAALQAQAVFLGDWLWAARELLDLPWDPRAAETEDSPVLIVPSSPAQRLETASLVNVELLHAADERIWIATPYFVPDRAVMAALRVAALRGVDVRILIVKKADSLPVHLASFYYVNALQGLGIRFYRYREGFMHQKVVLVDDEFGAVGTVNWDSRSFRLNFEVNVIVAEREFTERLAAMLEDDMTRCDEVLEDELENRSFVFRFGVQVARLMSPVL